MSGLSLSKKQNICELYFITTYVCYNIIIIIIIINYKYELYIIKQAAIINTFKTHLLLSLNATHFIPNALQQLYNYTTLRTHTHTHTYRHMSFDFIHTSVHMI
jgi:hypothetical protein